MDATDRVKDLLVETLAHALAVSGEHRLFRAGKLDGLFPGRSAVYLEAAEYALREGLLQRVRVETRGKTETEWVQMTPQGVEFLHQHESPVHALHELRETLRANQAGIPLWLDVMRSSLREVETRLCADADRWLQRLQAMETRVNDTLRRLEATGPLVPEEVLTAHPWSLDAINYLDRRRNAGGSEPCPLPELFAAVVAHHPTLSLTLFNDGMRQLYHRRAVLLLPAEEAMPVRAEYLLLDPDGVFYLVAR